MKHSRSTKRIAAADTGLVVIEWDVPSVSVARFESPARQSQLTQQFSIRIPSDVTSDAKIGSWLRQQFSQNGITGTSAVLVIPRRHISTRLFEIPTDDQNEISAICRLQMKASSTGEDIREVGDYLLGPASKAGSSYVFLATMPWVKLDSIKTALKAAGIMVKGIHVAEFVLANTLATSASGLTMHVLARDRRIELVVCSQGNPIAAQTFPFLDDSPDVASVMPALGSRVLQSVPLSFRNAGLASVDLYGADATKLVSYFEKYFDVPVHFPDTRREPRLALLAVAKANAMEVPAIDFVSPKVDSIAPPSRSRRTSRMVLAAVLYAFVLGVSAFYNLQLDRQFTELRRVTEQTAKANLTRQSTMDAHRFLSEWNTWRIDLPTQFAALAEHLPSHDRAYLRTLHVNASRKRAATINAKGHAKTAADVVEVHDRIVDDPRFVLHPQGILPKESDDYKAEFSLRVTVESHR